MTQWTDEIKAILKGEKRLSKSYAWMIFLCGLLLFVIFMPTKQSSRSLTTITGQENESQQTDKEKKQQELANFLSQIEGVGQCSVLICMEQTKDSMFREEEKITGVLVAASGAGNGAVKAMIVESVMALYGLEANKVQVFPIKK